MYVDLDSHGIEFLSDDTFEGIYNNDSIIENVDQFKEAIKRIVDYIYRIINIDLEKMNDKEFYDLIKYFYYIKLDENDYLEMISRKNNCKYTKIVTIPTTMVFDEMVEEGHRKSFSYWKQHFQVYLQVTTNLDIISSNHVYTVEEIKKLLLDKSIVVVSKEARDLNKKLEFEEDYISIMKDIPSLDIYIDDMYSMHELSSKFIVNNFELFIELLRSKFTKKKILRDMKKCLITMQEEMEEVFKYTDRNYGDYTLIAKLCKKWFDESEEKEKYNAIKKVLSKKI